VSGASSSEFTFTILLTIIISVFVPARAVRVQKLTKKFRSDKIREYRADYNNRLSHSISFIPAVASTSDPVKAAVWRGVIFFAIH